MWDRFYDLYVHMQMQKIVGDHLRPADARDPSASAGHGHGQRAMNDRREMAGKTWAIGGAYGLVDCAASPALFYANTAVPIDPAPAEFHGLFRPPDGAAFLHAGARGS